MNEKNAKQIVKKYKTLRILVILAYVAALAILIVIMTKSVLLGIAGVAVLAASIRLPFEKMNEKYVESIIYEELDPEKFGEILALGVMKKSIHAKMLYLMSSGKHDEILSLLKENEAKTLSPVDKCANLYREGFVYFERGEYEKLPDVVKRYESLKKDNPKLAYIMENYTVFDKFDAFADDDFEYVVDVCDIDLNELSKKKQNHKITKVNVGFYRAVSLYKLGRMDEAREGFEDIIAFAPKMHKAKLSKEFIDLIDG